MARFNGIEVAMKHLQQEITPPSEVGSGYSLQPGTDHSEMYTEEF